MRIAGLRARVASIGEALSDRHDPALRQAFQRVEGLAELIDHTASRKGVTEEPVASAVGEALARLERLASSASAAGPLMHALAEARAAMADFQALLASGDTTTPYG